MTSTACYAVVLAGGRGERFWPLSTTRTPKQFLPLFGDKTMLAQAVERLDGLVPPERIFVITHQDHCAAAQRATPQLPAANIVGEPVGRDTGAAVALGGALVARHDPEASFAVVTADHVIGEHALFRRTLADGLELARSEEALVTIGMRPDHASTGFGYIEAGAEAWVSDAGNRFFHARRFVEKPDRKKAEGYLASGRYYWNAGMFMWTVPVLQAAFDRHRPPLAGVLRTLTDVPAAGLDAALRDLYAGLEKISIDYAIMEQAERVMMAEGRFPWDDVGSWPAWARHFPADDHGNVVRGRVETLDAARNVVIAGDGVTALIGVEDLMVVRAGEALLVCSRDKAQEIKTMVQALAARGDCADVL